MLLDDRGRDCSFSFECFLENYAIAIELQSQTVQMEAIEYFIPKSNFFTETSGTRHRPLLPVRFFQ